jgi:hypothetical protein
MPMPDAYAYAYAFPDAMPWAGPAHAPPHVRGPWGLRPRGREAVRRGAPQRGPRGGRAGLADLPVRVTTHGMAY